MAEPLVTIFCMGGTIVGKGVGPSQITDYELGPHHMEEVIAGIPYICETRSKQVENIGGPDITSRHMVELSKLITNELLHTNARGAVVMHGTDTIEDTAFFLDLSINSPKPVVLVGAMRPATAYGADGPMNLMCAIKLALDPEARDRGVMITHNQQILPARFATKTDTTALESLRAVGPGSLGLFVSEKARFYYPPCRPNGHQYYDISRCIVKDVFPKVSILIVHPEWSAKQLTKEIEGGADGIVLAALGSGCLPTNSRDDIASFMTDQRRSIPIVISRRVSSGYVEMNDHRFIGGGFLEPCKCRILLQLAIYGRLNSDEMRAAFQ